VALRPEARALAELLARQLVRELLAEEADDARKATPIGGQESTDPTDTEDRDDG
jgi:hypothetical protein